MRPAILKSVILVLALTPLSTNAIAQTAGQPPCNPRDQVIEQLADRYKEAPIAAGITSKGSLVEVLTTGDGNTWTIIVSTPQGQSCIVAAGEGWRKKQGVALGPET